MSFLKDKILKASQAYYSDGSSDLSDREFDKLLAELRNEDPNSELLTAVGHGYSVAADTSADEKVKHKYGEVGSLSKAYSFDELSSFLVSGSIHVSLKLDGLSVALYYEHGDLVQAVTRGDGYEGFDITHKIKKVLPSTSLRDRSFTGAVRGEILMSYDNFSKYKELHPDAKNARNSAVGIIKSKSISPDLSYIDVIVYTVIGVESSESKLDNRIVIQEWLDANFGKTAPNCILHSGVCPETFIQDMNTLRDAWYGVYPADGLVLSALNSYYVKDTHEVRYSYQAFKFESETAKTLVTEVEWSLTKNRYLMPTVLFDAIELAGTTVQRATGYNAKFILDNNIDTGALVEVEKHGEIIPNINTVIRPAPQLEFPSTCPCCHSSLDWEGVHLKCNNIACDNACRQDVIFWICNLVSTDGLGEKLLNRFLDIQFGKTCSVEDVMRYVQSIDTLPPASGAKQTIFNDTLLGLKHDKFELRNALRALNIPRLGHTTSAKLSKYPDLVWSICNANTADEAALIASEALGQADSAALAENLAKFKRLLLIKGQVIVPQKTVEVEHSFERIRVAITGSLSVSRSEFTKELSEYGFEVSDIRKDTKYLVTDDPLSSSSKNRKATELGIAKLTELEFRNRFMK